MESLVGYGSDEENDNRFAQGSRRSGGGGGGGGGGARRDDDTNYDDVTMDMSEDSNNNESDRELPPAELSAGRGAERPAKPPREKEHSSSPRRERRRDERERDRHARDKDREHCDGKRSERSRCEGSSSSSSGSSGGRRGVPGDRLHDKTHADTSRVPALMDLKPFGGEPPPGLVASRQADTKDLARGSERERRDRDRDRERDRERDSHRDKDRHSRRSPDRKPKRRSRSRSPVQRPRSPARRLSRERGRFDKPRDHTAHDSAAPYPHRSSGSGSGGPPSAATEFRTSYKVSKKLQVMEKMGLQIKTPDGSMATAQQLMSRTFSEQQGPAPTFFKPGTPAASLVSQVQKRKLLWSQKDGESKPEAAPVPAAAAKWTTTKFAQDTDGKVASKFMRLMGIKDPEAVKPATVDPREDVNKQQEEMFRNMQTQYDVARATTHTMRGQGLGFQRHY